MRAASTVSSPKNSMNFFTTKSLYARLRVEIMKISFGTALERSLFQKIALGIPASISCLAVTVLGEGIF